MKEDFEKLIAKHKATFHRELPENHRIDFMDKLDNELHKANKSTAKFWMVAASIIVLLGIGYFAISNSNKPVIPEKQLVKTPVNNEISPELKKIENYYLTAINYELANLKVSKENRAVLNKYLSKIEKLTKEYKNINNELKTKEINEVVVNKLIDNLQMRLQLLIELKTIINKTKSNTNEKVTV